MWVSHVMSTGNTKTARLRSGFSRPSDCNRAQPILCKVGFREAHQMDLQYYGNDRAAGLASSVAGEDVEKEGDAVNELPLRIANASQLTLQFPSPLSLRKSARWHPHPHEDRSIGQCIACSSQREEHLGFGFFRARTELWRIGCDECCSGQGRVTQRLNSRLIYSNRSGAWKGGLVLRSLGDGRAARVATSV